MNLYNAVLNRQNILFSYSNKKALMEEGLSGFYFRSGSRLILCALAY